MIVSHLEALWIVARRELVEHLKSKRLLVTSGSYLGLLVLVLVLFANIPAFRGEGSGPLQVLLIIHTDPFRFVFITILAIILMADTISGEWKDRTLILLFTRPVARGVVLLGKFVGGVIALYVVMFVAVLVGFVGGIFLVGPPGGTDWANAGKGTAWLMLALLPMAAFGMFLSAMFRSPTTSFIVGVLMKFVGFPVITNLALLIELARGNLRDAYGGELMFIFSFIDPDTMIRLTRQAWDPVLHDFESGMYRNHGLGDQFGWGAVAIVVHLAFYFAASYVVVQRRDYP